MSSNSALKWASDIPQFVGVFFKPTTWRNVEMQMYLALCGTQISFFRKTFEKHTRLSDLREIIAQLKMKHKIICLQR